METRNSPLDTYWNLVQCKDRESVSKLIIHYLEAGTGKSITELKKEKIEDDLFFIALKHVTTTKKSLIKALNLNIDNCCRHKRKLEKKDLLVESGINYRCPYTGRLAKLLTTNKEFFSELDGSSSNQLSLF